jgi:adenylosuccinate synthase
MPTHIDLPSDLHDLPQHISSDVKRAAFIRETAHEYGTTTGRPRDILNLDLAMLTYNCHVSGVDVLAGTHLDLAREDEPIRVCTHYEKNGKLVRYQPGLAYLEGVTPSYIELPGWDGSGTKNVQHVESLPLNAQKFLAFIQRRTGFPIIAVTTGASRDQLITFEGYTQ